MRRSTITASALILTFVAGVVAAPSAAARVSLFSDLYYKCQSGFVFETAGSSARCRKPSHTDRRALADCPPPPLMYPAADRIGTKDMCAVTNPLTGEIGVERSCKVEDRNTGYTKRVVTGLDFCGKVMPEQIQAPDRAVVLTL